MSTTFKEVLKTLHGFDNNPVELNHLEDGSVIIHVMPLSQTETKTEEVPGKSKWAKFADDMAEANYLEGKSEEVNKYVREFRDSFAFREE